MISCWAMAGCVFTTDPSKTLQLRLGKDGYEAAAPLTIGDVFRRAVKQYGDANALASKAAADGEWKKLTYKEYYNLCVKAAKSFIKLGVEKYSTVIIIGFNSVEWFVSSIGSIFAGGMSNGVYATNSPDICQYIAKDSNTRIAVVENDHQLQKFLQIRDNLPNLQAIVQYKGKVKEKYPNVYDWEEFMKIGESVETQTVEDIISSHKPNECCTLLYTSGTTGEPKGVMLSHDNATFTAQSIVSTYKGVYEVGREQISYLPLSHIAGQMADIYVPMVTGLCIYFAQPDALKGSLGDTLREVQPHVFISVPRVWEKFMAKIQQMLPPPGSGPPPTPEVMEGIIQKVQAGLGLSRAKIMITCSAPTDLKVFQFFAKLKIMLGDIWGMTEGSGPGTTMCDIGNRYKLQTIGKPFVGVEVKIDNPDSSTGEGEICFRGRTVMMGYVNKLEKTREAIDDDGWMHSGDLGQVDEDGFFKITGRIKELIITSGGENIAPVPIEQRIKKHAPFLSNVMLIGDKRKYVSCLVTIKCDMDLNTGRPLDTISPDALPVISVLGSKCTKVSEIVESKDKLVYDAIQQALDKANEEAISRAQRVQKFVVLKEDFSNPGGELGPTLKLKRFYVVKKYASEIDSMYVE